MKSPAQPKIPTQVEQPKVEDKAVQDAAAEANKRRALSRGYRSTILSDMVATGQNNGKQNFGS